MEKDLLTKKGHLEAAAGIAGLIKTILILQHKKIPKQIHFNQLNHIQYGKISFLIKKFRFAPT